jgi:hypothetical protein
MSPNAEKSRIVVSHAAMPMGFRMYSDDPANKAGRVALAG